MTFDELKAQVGRIADQDLARARREYSKRGEKAGIGIWGSVLGNLDLNFDGTEYELVKLGDMKNPFGFVVSHGSRCVVREALIGCYEIVNGGQA